MWMPRAVVSLQGAVAVMVRTDFAPPFDLDDMFRTSPWDLKRHSCTHSPIASHSVSLPLLSGVPMRAVSSAAFSPRLILPSASFSSHLSLAPDALQNAVSAKIAMMKFRLSIRDFVV